MSSYATQDPSAYTYANNGAGHGLWSTTSTFGTPTLNNPTGSSALSTGLSAAANGGYSLTPLATTATTTPTTTGTYSSVAPTAITTPTYATSSQQLNAAAAAPASTAAAAATPSLSKVAAPSVSKLGIAVNTGANSVNTVYTPTQTVVPLATFTNPGNNTWAKWDPTTGTYVAMTAAENQAQNGAAATISAAQAQIDPRTGMPTGQDVATTNVGLHALSGYNTQAAQAQAALAQQSAGLAAGSTAATTAAQTTPVTLAPTVQGSNFDFSNAFNTTPTLNAATATAQQGQNALASQLSTNNYQSGNIAAGGRYGAAEAVNSAGTNQLALQQAAATDTDNNLTQFANALTAQSAAASSYTGAQAQADISNIQDDVTALSSQLTTLDSATRANVQTQLTSLQNQINQYNEAVQQAGADSGVAQKIFAGILAAGAIASAVLTGGATTGAAVAATANAANTIAS
jgi:hypothetical protein